MKRLPILILLSALLTIFIATSCAPVKDSETADLFAQQWYAFEDFNESQCLQKWKRVNISGSSELIQAPAQSENPAIETNQAVMLKWGKDSDGVELKYFPVSPINILVWQKIRIFAAVPADAGSVTLNMWLHDGNKGVYLTGSEITPAGSWACIEFDVEDAKTQIDAAAVREVALVISYVGDNGTIILDKIEALSEKKITAAGASAPSLPITSITASSGQKNSGTLPIMALDGRMDTRWSSEFTDNEWLQIDFNSPIDLVGLKLHWEAAYGRDYEIQLLQPDDKWITASRIKFGDGGVDEIYFGPHKAKAIKMLGHKRGTGWGYSLWEVGILGPEDEIFASASSTAKGMSSEAILDGKTETYWQSASNPGKETVVEFTFPRKFGVGGLQIDWTKAQTPACKIEAFSEEANKWQMVMNKKASFNNQVEDLFFAPVYADKLRFVFAAKLTEPVRIADIQVKGTSEGWTPVRHFEMLAQRLPDGLLPNWLSRLQAFWTVTGLPGSFNESLLEEYGKIESGLRNFSVTPALMVDGKLLSAKNFQTSQSLAEEWIPIPNVKWLGNGLEMNITANTIAPDTTVVLYKLSNTSKQTRDISLLLAARPLQVNPPWQHGGYSQIKQAQWQDKTNTLILNDQEAMRLCSAPVFVSTYNQRPTTDSVDVIECLLGNRTDGNSISSPDGIISAGVRYDYKLKAGETKSILAIYPNEEGANITAPKDGEKFFSEEMVKSIKLWKETIGNWNIDIPDKKLANLIRSNLAYLLINADGPATQPGSRNYNSSWIRDGAISATAMMRFGLVDNGATYLKWFTGLIKDDGFVPFLVNTKTGQMANDNWQEYDSFGEYVFLVRQVVELTDDDEIAKLCWPKIKAVMKYMENLRSQRLTEKYKGTEYEGILPESVSHEGYIDPPRHSYWDDFFALKGLQDAQAIALRLGHKEDAEWLAKFETDMRKSVLESIERVRTRDSLATIPACAELGDFDPTSTSIGIMVADERDTLPADALKATYDKYMEESKFRAAQPVGTRSLYTPYEVRNISAMLRLGRIADAQMLLDFFVEDGVRPVNWNHMGEVVHGDLRTPSYIGDMPHTWVGAGLINAIRDMLVYEERGRLVLAAGVYDRWLDKGVSVSNLQTWWGPISYTLERNKNGQVILKLRCSQQPPNGFVVPDGVKLILQ
ncbi:MAG: discoidin domain-containing protein [Candidatus Omnitrophica bacterium]|nr:discoidin domain-containing protein [Candidatus Omnitrophota bacterium]MBU1889839.1 discoidin domain-containing protein [Candidatus Omnitrophota bacterium]